VGTLESQVEAVLREAFDGKGVLRDDWDSMKLDSEADFMLLGRKDDECVLPVQNLSRCSE
jgi:hypothetical protein